VDVLQDCHDLLGGDEEHGGQAVDQLPSQRHRELVQELVNYPDLYDALNYLLHQPGGGGPGVNHPDSANDQPAEAADEVRELSAGEGGGLERDESPKKESNITEAGPLLSLSEDVMKYFHEERSRREELVLDEIGRRVFGS
jgi:hypothetical protein